VASLAVTVNGQVTLQQDLLQHLGIQPGDRVDFEKWPGGEVRIRAARPAGTIENFFGILAGRTDKVATIEEINEAIAAGWAGDK
jgi:bifunctional DNA-binding transcriptional regulator/antitoxin component of YhaV-PrlF toxin-antitoxin module